MRIKHAPPESSIWAFMRWADIPSTTNLGFVYLRRLRIAQTPWFALYIHWINEPDTDRDPHDHPWTFWSLILSGAYTETLYQNTGDTGRDQTWGRWTVHRMPTNLSHRITSVLPGTVTLVVTGRRVREWCFWTETGMVPWRRYLASHDLNPQD